MSLQENSLCIDANDTDPMYNDPGGTSADMSALLIEYHEKWITDRKYLDMEEYYESKKNEKTRTEKCLNHL